MYTKTFFITLQLNKTKFSYEEGLQTTKDKPFQMNFSSSFQDKTFFLQIKN